LPLILSQILCSCENHFLYILHFCPSFFYILFNVTFLCVFQDFCLIFIISVYLSVGSVASISLTLSHLTTSFIYLFTLHECGHGGARACILPLCFLFGLSTFVCCVFLNLVGLEKRWEYLNTFLIV
jgi:hypothetical protein